MGNKKERHKYDKILMPRSANQLKLRSSKYDKNFLKKGRQEKFDLIFNIIFKGLKNIKYYWAMPKPPPGGHVSHKRINNPGLRNREILRGGGVFPTY